MKEQLKIEASVFDRYVFRTVGSLMSAGIIASIDFPIKRGKESVVFRATPPPDYPAEFLAVKIYNVENSNFKRMVEYISNDPRFEVKKNRRKLVYEWVKKEYRNLLMCEEMGVLVPHPHVFKDNVLVMDFIGEGGAPSKTLFERGPANPEWEYEFLMGEVKKMYKNGFVHADLSEYNVLCGPEGKLYMIDLAQGVIKGHPFFDEWYKRDVQNINRYYEKFGVRATTTLI